MKKYETRQRIIGRFAPSPTGRMHLGNIWVALLNFLEVRKAGGLNILRIEDLDQGRSRPEYSQLLLDDLAWLGIDFDLGNREIYAKARDKRYTRVSFRNYIKEIYYILVIAGGQTY